MALLIAVMVLLASLACGGASAPVPEGNGSPPDPPARRVGIAVVATYHNDNSRSGLNAGEGALGPANVNAVSFGRLAAIPVQGDIYAQPLYIPNVSMGANGVHNLVIVATEHDQVYAYDVDSRQLMWNTSYVDSEAGITPVSSSDVGCDDIAPEIGISGTPVIDTASNTMYLVARTKETQNGSATFHQRFHALDLATGKDKLAATEITTPPDPNGQFGVAQFDALINNQRSALLLANGQVYVAWASHCDLGIYQGWLMSFDQTTLQLTAAWTPSPSGLLGGIWMTGAGPSSDSSGDIYLAVGNGLSNAMSGQSDYADSVVRLHPSGNMLTVTDYFIPFNFEMMSEEDLDLGITAPLLLPDQPGAAHPHLLTVTGKNGTVYLLDRDNLGHWQPTGDGQIMESFPSGALYSFSNPAMWNSTLYFAWNYVPVTALAYDPTLQQIITTPVTTSGTLTLGHPGACPSISSYGKVFGVVWILETDNYAQNGPDILRAFDVKDMSKELYDTNMSPGRDRAGLAVKFTVPTVADGMVFVGARSELDIYGVLP